MADIDKAVDEHNAFARRAEPLRKRISELERERAGLTTFIAKQAANIRVLQRRLAAAGLDAKLPGDAERQSITND